MKKKLFSALFCIALALSLLPTAALAETVYPTSVKLFNGSSAAITLADGEYLATNDAASASSGWTNQTYVARYDSSAGTLYLNGYAGKRTAVSSAGDTVIAPVDSAYTDFNIVVESASSVTLSCSYTALDGTKVYGIYSAGTLNISGSGKLTVNCTNSSKEKAYSYIYDVYAEKGMTITAPLDAIVKADGQGSAYARGLGAWTGHMSLSGGDKSISAVNNTTKSNSIGTYVYKGSVGVNGKLSINPGGGYGIYVNCAGDGATAAITLTKATVEIQGNNAKSGLCDATGSLDSTSRPSSLKQGIEISDSKFIMTSSNTKSYGIEANCTGLSINSSTVTANVAKVPINIYKSSVSVKNSDVTLTSTGMNYNTVNTTYSTAASTIDLSTKGSVTLESKGSSASVLIDCVTLASGTGLAKGTETTGRLTGTNAYTGVTEGDYTVVQFKSTSPRAAASNATVSGTVGTAITSTDVTVTLTNDTFKSEIAAGTDISGWLNLPAGLTAKVKSAVSAGATEVSITVSGTPTAVSSDTMAITIPAASLTSAADLTVTSNVNAKFAIGKGTLTAEYFDFTAPANLTYDGTDKTATVTLKNNYSGAGAVTVKYEKSGSSVNEAKNTGTYTVKIDVAAGTNYEAASDLTASDWTFTIAPATWGAPTEALTAIDPTITGGSDGQITGTTTAMQYRKSTDDSWTDCVGDVTGLYSGTYFVRYKADGNHNASETNYTEVTLTDSRTISNGNYTPTYAVSVDEAEHGSVNVSTKNASPGTIVTITTTPDKGRTLETLTVTDRNGNTIDLTVAEIGKKYTFKMPSGNVTVKATFMEDNSMLNYFIDVNARDYFYDAVLWAAENGITMGTDDLHFSPDNSCTRGQIVTFLWRAAGSPEPKSLSDFTDVAVDSYCAKAVAWAVENGITEGTGYGKFSPNSTCTRAQAVTLIYRCEKLSSGGMDGMWMFKNPFTDVKTDSYYFDAVMWAVANDITEGTTDTTFSPDDTCTRGQIVTFLFRAYNK